MSQGYSFCILVKLIIVNTCRASSEAELLGDFSPSKGILCLDLNLEVDLHLELGEGEGGLVPEIVLDRVLRARDDHAGPGVAVGRVVVSLQVGDLLININLFFSFFIDAVVFSQFSDRCLIDDDYSNDSPAPSCRAGDTAQCSHNCPSSS